MDFQRILYPILEGANIPLEIAKMYPMAGADETRGQQINPLLTDIFDTEGTKSWDKISKQPPECL